MKRKGAALTQAEVRGSQTLNGANRLQSFVIAHRKYMYFLSYTGALKFHLCPDSAQTRSRIEKIVHVRHSSLAFAHVGPALKLRNGGNLCIEHFIFH